MLGTSPPRSQIKLKASDSVRQSSQRDFYAAKKREMILQLREPSLVGKKMLFDTREVSAASWVRLVIIDLFDKKYRRTSHLRNADAKSFGFCFCFCFCFCDRGKHNFLNRRNPAFISGSIAHQRAKAEYAEATHCPFLKPQIMHAGGDYVAGRQAVRLFARRGRA
jgi:hypothetical protein